MIKKISFLNLLLLGNLNNNIISMEEKEPLSKKINNCNKVDYMLLDEKACKDIIELILSLDTNINIKDKSGNTALIKASNIGSKSITELLLDAGADVNIQNNYQETALMLATKKGHTEIVRLLLNKSACFDLKDHEGYTALMFAAQKGHIEIVKLLLDAGANIYLKDNHYGWTAFNWALYYRYIDTAKLISLNMI